MDLFFVISGFIMVHTTARRRQSPAAFLANRLLRIAPLYWTLTALLFALALAAPGLLGATRADPVALLKSLAFIPGERADGTMRPVLFVGWSLNLEMAFYCVFALCLTVADLRRVLLGVAVLVAIAAFGFAARQHLAPELRFLTQPILLEFAAGMALGYRYQAHPGDPRRARAALALMPLAFLALIAAATLPEPLARALPVPPALAPAAWLVWLALRAEAGGRVLAARPVQALGDASYALYLSHPFVTQGFAFLAAALGLIHAGTAPALMIACVALAALVGLAVHRGLELPLTHLARRLCTPATRTRAAPAGAE
ncbi:acyltransferase family protein [Novosphingobium colocasiae]